MLGSEKSNNGSLAPWKGTWKPAEAVLPELPSECLELLVEPSPTRDGLANARAFAGISPEWAAWLEAQSTRRRFPGGADILKEGQEGDSLFVLVSGRAKVSRRRWGSTGQFVVGLLPSGSVFGEIALLAGGPRRATVTALCDCEVIEIPKPAIQILCERVPSFSRELRRLWMQRVIDTPPDPTLKRR